VLLHQVSDALKKKKRKKEEKYTIILKLYKVKNGLDRNKT